jgi:hypothetical protein
MLLTFSVPNGTRKRFFFSNSGTQKKKKIEKRWYKPLPLFHTARTSLCHRISNCLFLSCTEQILREPRL